MPPPLPGRPEAAAAIWSQSAGIDRFSRCVAVAKVRRRAGRQAFVGIAVGLMAYALGWRIVGVVAVVLGLATLLVALLSPAIAYPRLEKANVWFAAAVARAATWLVMGIVYFAVLTPLGLLVRRGRNDPLKRRLEPNAVTYWSDRKERATASDRPF